MSWPILWRSRMLWHGLLTVPLARPQVSCVSVARVLSHIARQGGRRLALGTLPPTARTSHPEPARAGHGNDQIRRVVTVAAVLLYASFLASYGLNQGELHRNEGLRALVAAESLRTGHWLV